MAKRTIPIPPEARGPIAEAVHKQRGRLSQPALGAVADVSASFISALENERAVKANPTKLAGLSEAFGWAADMLERMTKGEAAPEANASAAPPDVQERLMRLEAAMFRLEQVVEALSADAEQEAQ